MPVGIGYDVHRFAEGRRLVLLGVEFDEPPGLLGHSDADVATHAIIDALLGAAALGDIGQHFPPDDPKWAGARSIELLKAVSGRLSRDGWQPVNVDVTIVAERPKIGPRAPEMRRLIGEAIGLDPDRVGVKATTNEGLGFVGRGEGIVALAVAEVTRSEPARPPSNVAASSGSVGSESRA